MKRVYISSPLSGNINKNIIKAVRFGEFIFKECGAVPIVPHFYALMLDDINEKDREIGILADLSLIWMIDELWVFGEEITDCMKTEVTRAELLKIPIRYFSDNDVNKILMKYGGNLFERKYY